MKLSVMQKYAAWSVLVLLALAAAVWAFRPPAMTVDVGQVRLGRFEQTLSQDGRLRVQYRYTLSAPTAAELVRPSLRVGDSVEAGQVVATLMPVAPQMIDARSRSILAQRVGSAQAGRAAAVAQLRRQQTAVAQAQLESERAQKLASQNFLSASARDQAALTLQAQQRALEGAQAEAHMAAHAESEARAALEASQGIVLPDGVVPGRWNLTSPIAGRVIKLQQESAGPVAVGQSLMEIADTTRVDAVIDVLSGDAARVQVGALVHLTLGTGVAQLDGRVARIEPVAFTKVSALGIEEQRVNLIVQLQPSAAQQAAIGEGYRVDALIQVSAQDAVLLVSAAALVRDGAQWSVFVVQAERAQRRRVQVRERNADVAWLQSGVDVGERVVLYPGAALADGQRVQVRN